MSRFTAASKSIELVLKSHRRFSEQRGIRLASSGARVAARGVFAQESEALAPIEALAPRVRSDPTGQEKASTAWSDLLPTELAFYEEYGWCLDPHLTVGRVIACLKCEIGKLYITQESWQ